MIAIPTFRIEPTALSKRFKQRGLPATVLADEKGDTAPKRYVDPLRQRLDIERVSSWIELLWELTTRRRNGAPVGGNDVVMRRVRFIAESCHN